MIEISLETAQGLVASHNDDSEEWVQRAWDQIEEQNPHLISVIIEYMDAVKAGGLPDGVEPLDAWCEGLLAGFVLTYKAILRQYESDEFEKEFA